MWKMVLVFMCMLLTSILVAATAVPIESKTLYCGADPTKSRFSDILEKGEYQKQIELANTKLNKMIAEDQQKGITRECGPTTYKLYIL